MAAPDSVSSIFGVLTYEDVLKRLPLWFGEGIEGLEVNLSDPTTGKRIRVPGRGFLCDHIDIVDVQNSTRAIEAGDLEWMCPVCGLEYSNTSEILVDMLIVGVLKELEEDDEEETHKAINLFLDGDWKGVGHDRLPMTRKKRLRLSLAEARALVEHVDTLGEAPDVIDLDSD